VSPLRTEYRNGLLELRLTKPCNVVVVGGGISGIVAATEAALLGASVVLLEAASTCGGLLRSVHTPQGDVFDYGTHLLTETGHATLDERYIHVMATDEVVRRPHLLPGGYSFGTLRARGMWMDWSGTHPQVHARWFRGLMAATVHPETTPPTSAADLLRQRFGQEALVEAFSPVLRKLQAAEPDELVPEVVKLFGLQRVAMLTPGATRLLKQDPALDERLAFHDCAEQHRERAVIYPARGGIGAWVQRLVERAQAIGVRFVTGCATRRLLHSGSRITAVDTAHGVVSCDRLVWTAPPQMLLQAAAEPSPPERPRMLTTVLVHMVCDSAPTIESQFVTCFDPLMQNFRVTLYSNFRPCLDGRHPVTVEFLTSGEGSAGLNVDTALDELLQMGILAPGTRVLESKRDEHVAGFPVLTRSFVKQGAKLAQQVKGRFGNVFLAGKALGQDFFMVDVMTRVIDDFPLWLQSDATR
jgi:protoporphyrinogen oxidase